MTAKGVRVWSRSVQTALLWIANIRSLMFAGSFLMAVGLICSLAYAETEVRGSCLIKVDGLIYDTEDCGFQTMDEHTIKFGNLEGFWAYIYMHSDSSFDGSWNGIQGTKNAQHWLGIMEKESLGKAECWFNELARLCKGLEPNIPIYYIEHYTEARELKAFVDGIEYQIPHSSWDGLQPYFIDGSADLDGDGRLETLIRVSHGGNCCPEDISILSYRGDGFFTYLDKTPISGGWGGVEIVQELGRPIIRIHDEPLGIGNLATERSQRDYAIINGRPELIAQRSERSFPSQIAGLTLEEVKASEGQRSQLNYDINQDGYEDVISCDYWQRWGVLNCSAHISGVSSPIDLQCRRVSISTSVFAPQKSHRIICDGKVVPY